MFSHGFINGNQNTAVDLNVLRRREQKWMDMINHWDDFMQNQYQKLRSRCRKGIPPATRPQAWFHLCGAKYLMTNPRPNEDSIQGPSKFDLLCVSMNN